MLTEIVTCEEQSEERSRVRVRADAVERELRGASCVASCDSRVSVCAD